MKSTSNRKNKRQPGIINRIVSGRIITSDLFIDNWKAVTLACIMMLIYIHNRYECTTRMETIQRLENRLEIAETELMRERSTYMSRIRESSMVELVERHGLRLKVQEQPPYHIKRNH